MIGCEQIQLEQAQKCNRTIKHVSISEFGHAGYGHGTDKGKTRSFNKTHHKIDLCIACMKTVLGLIRTMYCVNLVSMFDTKCVHNKVCCGCIIINETERTLVSFCTSLFKHIQKISNSSSLSNRHKYLYSWFIIIITITYGLLSSNTYYFCSRI